MNFVCVYIVEEKTCFKVCVHEKICLCVLILTSDYVGVMARRGGVHIFRLTSQTIIHDEWTTSQWVLTTSLKKTLSQIQLSPI